MLILNDVHIGVQRKGGTTPASQEALRTYLFQSLRQLLTTTEETELVILGDLFDQFEVPPRDWIDTYEILSNWLSNDNALILVAGNHDYQPRGVQVSSFQMLANVLQRQSDDTIVIGIDEYARIAPGVIALAHCSSQQVFDQKLNEILNLDLASLPTHLLLHANYDNKFVEHSDHSLNVSLEQAKAFAERGTTLVFAHEHQARNPRKNVIVLGNQWPTSIADCLGNPGNEKCGHILLEGELSKFTTWSATGSFVEVDWLDLNNVPAGAKFVRVTGDVGSAEAGDVITKIAAFRRGSDAFIVSNAVRVDGIVEAEDLPATFEVAKKFDVMNYIREHLTEQEMEVVERLIKEEA